MTMKKKIICLTLLTFLFYIFSYSSKLTVVPEITPSLSDIDVLDLTEEQITDTIIKKDSGVVFITTKGEIFHWHAEKRMKDFLYNLNRGILPDVFHQGDYLVLKEQDPAPDSSPAGTITYVIFDLKEMKASTDLKSNKIKKILGLNQSCLVYLSIANELTVLDYRSNKPLEAKKLPKKITVYNGEWQENKFFVLTTSHLYIYDQPRNTLETIQLKHKAVSDFLLDGRWIYYGSDQRELVKFSIKTRKSRWRFKIGDLLKMKPIKIGRYIAIVPEDNNIYFFNKNGTLHWWQKLDSTLRLPLKAMKENVAAFLWDNNVKFINFKKKEVVTYPLGRPVVSNPVHIDDYIYIVSEDEVIEREESQEPPYRRLSKIGNHYGVEIKTDPMHVKPLGKSIRFDLKPINLVEPIYKIKIIKTQWESQSRPVVFEKQISVDDIPSFVWMPNEPVEYKLIIEIEAKNKRGVKVEQNFKSIDIEKILKHYYYDIQARYSLNLLN
jgi:hypothetical protein